MASLVRGIRWNLQIRRRVSTTSSVLVAGFVWCFILSVLVPFRVGEGARLLWLRRYDVPFQFSLGVTIMERLVDLTTLLALGCLAMFFLPIIPVPLAIAATLGTMALFFGILILTLRGKPPSTLGGRIAVRRPFAHKLKQWLTQQRHLLSDGISTIRSKSTATAMITLSLMAWLILAFGNVLYLRAFDPTLPWSAGVAVMLATNLSSVVNISPGNLGVYHVAAIAVLAFVGMDGSEALVAATGMHAAILFGFLCAALLAKIFLTRHGQNLWEPV